MPALFHRQTHRLWLGAALMTLTGCGVMADAFARDYLTGEPGIGATGLDEAPGSILAPERGWSLGLSVERADDFGARPSYWLTARPRLGFSTASLGTGEEDGGSMGGASPARAPSSLDLAPGYRLMSAQGMYRLVPGTSGDEGVLHRPVPYVGLGAGVIKPDFESLTDRPGADDQEIAGAAVRGLAGLSYRMTPKLSLYGEYSLDYMDPSLRTTTLSPALPFTASRVLFGLSYGFE
jgi:hypothetical protein